MAFAAAAIAASLAAGSPDAAETLTGAAAFGDWRGDAPGVRRLIRPSDLPPPFHTDSAGNPPGMVAHDGKSLPAVPDGFAVSLFAEDLNGPRTIRVAPNGDVFVVESNGGRVVVLHAADGTARPERTVFADGFDYPYGLAFYPPGPEPQYVYVADIGRVVRFPYRNGDRAADADREVILAGIPAGGHVTRDIAFSPDGKRMFVAVGSRSNVAERLPDVSPEAIKELEAATMVGAAWGQEAGRAAILAFDPEGKNGRLFATGIRNCSGVAIEPATGELWCATNERDGLGDDLVPDYFSRIRDGSFYGWPWYYIGDNPDPRHENARPDLRGKITVPDVLIQAHSAPLGFAFYNHAAFPEEYRGDAFVALHGSWNRARWTGYKVVRVFLDDGVPTGVYEDFMTGFVLSDVAVWGRPVGIAVAKDGALLVSEDGNGTIWRVAPKD